MHSHQSIPIKEGRVKTYIFKAVVEPDEERWSAWCPALLAQGASTWEETREEALRNLEEVVHLVVESLQAHGDPIPAGPADQVQITSGPQVAVTL